MNKDLLSKLDAKMIRESGLFLALIASLWVIVKMTTNDIAHLGEKIDSGYEVQKETNEVLRDLSGNIRANTEVLRTITK